jgi:hypothetical protein
MEVTVMGQKQLSWGERKKKKKKENKREDEASQEKEV